MPLPRFRIRTLMIAVAVVAAMCAFRDVAVHLLAWGVALLPLLVASGVGLLSVLVAPGSRVPSDPPPP